MSARYSSLIITLVLTLSASVELRAQGLTLAVSQPTGPGSFELQLSGASASAELYNLVSLDPAIPTGSGPIFGLSFDGIGFVIDQLLMPIGTDPYHVLADASGDYFFGFTLPPAGAPPLDADFVSLEWSALLGVVDTSPVLNISLSF